jgi:cobalt-precorrin-7 (C5)-methyltransferase
MPRVIVIGIGPGPIEWISAAAQIKISQSDIVVAWDWSLKPFKHLVSGKKIYFQDSKNYLEQEKTAAEQARKTEENVAIIHINDPCVAPGLNDVLEIFKDFDIEVIPAVGAVQFAASAACICIDESVVIGFDDEHPEYNQNNLMFALKANDQGRNLIFLSSANNLPPTTARYLIDHGLTAETSAVIIEQFANEMDRVFEGTLDTIAKRKVVPTSVLVVKQPEPFYPKSE